MGQVQWSMKCQSAGGCSCWAFCPCETVGWPAPNSFCEYVMGMNIVEGHFGDVPLGGLKFAFVGRFPGAMHEGNGTCQYYIDVKANEAQRNALIQILLGRAGCRFFEIWATVTTTFYEPQFVPIDFEFDKGSRRSLVASEGLFATVSEPLRIPATGKENRVQVREPDGFLFKETEVANASFLWAGGKLNIKHNNTSGYLWEAEYTPEGVKDWSSR